MTPTTSQRPFGRTLSGEFVDLFTLTNARGMSVEITNYGATVTSLRVPDVHGTFEDVVLGFDSLNGYLGPHPFFGGTIGRFGNRIARGRFVLDGREHVLRCNNGVNHLHGGPRGFDRHLWVAHGDTVDGEPAVRLRRISPDGEEGYPGALTCEVIYTLTSANELRIDYTAMTDAPTIINLTHHSYFNLAGQGTGTVLDHQLFVDADAYLPVDETQIPTGEQRSVVGSPFDFREPRPIGLAMRNADPQFACAHGFDHNYVLNRSTKDARELRMVAGVFEPSSGRAVEVLTTEPGLQLYVGGFLDGTIVGKGGRRYQQHGAFCLEAQGFPDAPNQTTFPNTRLDPGDTHRSSTVYRFGAFSTMPAWKSAR